MLYLRFICDGSETALDCRDIIEVLPLVEMQPAGGQEDWCAGLMNYHGKPLRVIDLQVLRGGWATPRCLSTRVVVASVRGREHPLLCAQVLDTVRIQESELSAGELAGERICQRDGRLIRCYDAASLLAGLPREGA